MSHAIPSLRAVTQTLWKAEEGGKDARRSVVMTTGLAFCEGLTV